MSDWLDDARAVKAVMLRSGETFDRNVGDEFERIERPGEYCFIPWLRVRTFYQDGVSRSNQRTVELPLHSVTWIEFYE